MQIRRSMPPAPKVPKNWQATEFGALAKVTSAQAWIPDFAAARNVNLVAGGRVVFVDAASSGGSPPARYKGHVGMISPVPQQSLSTIDFDPTAKAFARER